MFRFKYAQGPGDTWEKLCERLVDDVCGTRGGTLPTLMGKEDMSQLTQYMKEMKFLAGGRYLYYAGRPYKAYNNCYLLRAEEDTREEWSAVTWRAMSCLMTGGGIGIDYSRLRAAGKALGRTGGTASGPIPLMSAINEIGRNVMGTFHIQIEKPEEVIPRLAKQQLHWKKGRSAFDLSTAWMTAETEVQVFVNLVGGGRGLGSGVLGLGNQPLDFRCGTLVHLHRFGARRNSLRQKKIPPRTRVTDALWNFAEKNFQRRAR